ALICAAFRSLGGPQEIVDNLAMQFGAAGHAVRVISNRDPAGPERTPRDQYELVFLRIPERKPASWKHLERLLRHPRGTRELKDFLGEWRPDIVDYHVTSWDHIPAVTHACHTAGVPVIHSFHGIFARRQMGDRALAALALANGVVTVSAFTRRHLAALSTAASNADVIICGVDTEAARIAVPIRRERPYIFCAGRLSLAHKAIDVLLGAFAMVAKRHPELDLLIAGDGPDRAQLERQADAAGLSASVRILGTIAHDELFGFYKGAVLFAMPSRVPEGIPLVFLEAMASGAAVVGTRDGGTPEIVIDGETGVLIDRNEPAELAAAILRLLDNPELRARMGRRAMELAALYGWPRVAQRYLEVYASRARSKLA
ncbi:MAG: glycosyltransferase family 4 protein, partial [Candidatus Binataceae bacterium]